MKRLLVLLLSLVASLCAAESKFRTWASTPPMGWNSWDHFGTTVTEEQTKQQAEFMAARLKQHGWQYVVVDIQWYEPNAKSHDYQPGAVLTMDEHGRLLPAPNRFPSSKDGVGFKALADHVHGLGLKFGVHLMRGIPRQAVQQNVPILGTTVRARDIANQNSICPWNPDMYGVDMSRPGAQEYYDSVFALFASWGVDYVKVDDISRPYHEHEREIEAIRKAIDRTGRPMVLSLSPGETALSAAGHVTRHANLWRISDDFWDRWLSLEEQFGRLEKWNPHRVEGAWPDADMLPLGVLVQGARSTRFTPDEQRTLMTLWSIARSPLMHGGDMTKTDDATLALLTNDAVLAVNQHSRNNRPLFNRDRLIAWTADVPDSPDKYLAVFNARDRVRLAEDNARQASPVLVRRGLTSRFDFDVDLSGGRKLFLVLDPTEDGSNGDVGVWRDARFIMADGSERRLDELTWTAADALWDSTRVQKDKAGKAIGIAAQAASVTEYAIPAGAARFKARGEFEARDDAPQAGSMRFLVVVGTAQNEDTGPGLGVAVELKELGFKGPARVQDLWTGKDVGEVEGTFSPVIPYHGAGLYRLSGR